MSGNTEVRKMHEELLNEHKVIVSTLEKILKNENDTEMGRRLIDAYVSLVSVHAKKEEQEFVPLCNVMDNKMDLTALEYAHRMLDEQYESVKEEVELLEAGRGKPERFLREANQLVIMIQDHFGEEEGHLFPEFYSEIRDEPGDESW